jgi:putative DNA primase/helicase
MAADVQQLEALSLISLNSTGQSGPGGPAPTLERRFTVGRSENGTGPGGPASGPDMSNDPLPCVDGYRINATGVFQQSGDPDKSDIQITYAPCHVLGLCRDGEQQNWGALLRWEDRDGKIHQEPYPVGRFHEQGGKVAVELANLGLPIVPGREKQLLRYFASCHPETRCRAAIQTGWQEGLHAFVLPLETIGRRIDGEIIVYQPERYSPTRRSVRMKGTLTDWKSDVAALCSGNPILLFWASVSLAAPLLRLVNQEGGGFHLYGRTSRGKTTAQQVAASVWGDGTDPAEGREASFVRKWNLTKNATEGLAEAHNDLPLCIDEIGEADPHEFGRTIYQLAGGQGKGRMKADATLKAAKIWRTLILSTGELPVADVLQSEGQRLRGGQAVRLLDIPATGAEGLGDLLTEFHGEKNGAAFADRLKRACSEDFGTAGPAFVNRLLNEDVECLTKELTAALAEVTQRLSPPGASPEVVRAMKRIALGVLAGEKAISLGLVPWKAGDALKAAKVVRDRYITARGRAGQDVEQVIEQIRGFILANATSRFRDLSNESERISHLVGYRDKASST